MSIHFAPIPNGITSTANPPSETHKYKLSGISDKNSALAYAMSGTPAISATLFGVLYKQDIQLTRAAYNQWDVTVPYTRTSGSTGDWSWDFDTTGGTVHITNAKQEVSRYPTTTAPDQKGAISVDGTEVKGTDIVIPAMKLNVQFKHPQGVVTLPYAKFLAGITGTVNSDPFLSFAAGEVLFLGARGADGSTSDATINYSFAMSQNVSGLTIGSIAGIAKKGWEIAWIRYEDTVTTADGKDQPTRVAKFVYVDRVYEEVNHAAAFGFGA